MSSASTLRAAVRARLPAALRLLVIGGKGFADLAADERISLEQLPPGPERYDAVVWFVRVLHAPQADTELRAGLSRLRTLLRAGGLLALVIEPAGALRQLWGALARTAADSEVTLEQASESLIMSGLLEPRVLLAGRHGLALCAHTASRFEPLDAFFEQPPA
jgi:hypothetical protein